MKLLTLSLFTVALFGFALCDDTDEDKRMEEIKTALKKMVEIIEKNQMNVTLIASNIDRWSNVKVKEVKEYSMRFPTYNVQPTESKITEEVIEDWIKTVKDLPEDAKLCSRSRLAYIEDGSTKKIETWPTSDDQVYETRLYKTITTVKDGERGFAVDNPSYETYYNMYVPGEGGKDQRIEVIAGHVKTEVMKKSDTLTDDEVKEMEKKFREVFFKYDCNKVMGRVLRDHMNKKMHDDDWQVMMNPGDDFYVPAKKFAWMRAANTEALVYSM